jgi:succinate dehydrogenase / fumarate reductase membrane anchor subunit
MTSSLLGRVRGLGSAHKGTHHWWVQRVSAIALIPLTIWCVCAVLSLLVLLKQGGSGASIVSGNASSLLSFIVSPINMVSTLLFLLVGLYHGVLGIKTIIEDYIHCEGMKFLSILIVNFITVLTSISLVTVVIVYHFLALMVSAS